MSESHRELAAALRRHIAHANRLHQQYLDDPRLFADYERFIDLQMAYFLPRYDDLRKRPGYDAAIDFVVSDLTGTGIAERDRDLERVAGFMTRTLPTRALEALTVAMELNARLLEMNLGIAANLRDALRSGEAISERDYCLASRSAATFEDCRTLIGMTRRAGQSLDRFAHLPLIRGLLHSMRIPARLAGFGDLQAFLEKGFDTFHEVPDIVRFLDDMEERMNGIFSRVFELDADQLDTAAIDF
jgi:hypothetical protein